MPTPKTKAELLATFADLPVSAPDLQDFVVSVPGLVGVLGLYTIVSDVELDTGVLREVDFTGQTADRDTIGITWDEDQDQFVVPEDGIYKIDVYALAYLGPISYVTDLPSTDLAMFHDADEPNPRTSTRDEEPAHYLSLTIPLTAGQGWSIGITTETDDPGVTTADWRCIVQVARLSGVDSESVLPPGIVSLNAYHNVGHQSVPSDTWTEVEFTNGTMTNGIGNYITLDDDPVVSANPFPGSPRNASEFHVNYQETAHLYLTTFACGFEHGLGSGVTVMMFAGSASLIVLNADAADVADDMFGSLVVQEVLSVDAGELGFASPLMYVRQDSGSPADLMYAVLSIQLLI